MTQLNNRKKIKNLEECFVCAECFEDFDTEAFLSKHICPMKLAPAMEVEIEARSDEGVFIPCDTVLQDSDELAFKCKLCPRVFKTIRGCRMHTNNHFKVKVPNTNRMKKKDSDGKNTVRSKGPYACSHCPHFSQTLTEYRKHFKTHCGSHLETTVEVVPCPKLTVPSTLIPTQNSHECPNCNKKFKKIGSYRRHLRTHLNIHAYTCKHCFLSFMTKSQLVDHIKRLHQGDKKFSCSLCNKKFHHRIGCKHHEMEHEDPPFLCLRCDAKFPSASRRIVHLENHPQTCPFCRKACANDEKMWEHLNAVHEDEIQNGDYLSDLSEPDDADSSDEVFDELDVESDADSFTSTDSGSEESVYSPGKGVSKGHVCFICERRFLKETSLEFHMKLHEIYQCPACSKFFPHFHELKTHQQEHVQNNSDFYSKAFDSLRQQRTQSVTQFCVARNPFEERQVSDFQNSTATTTDFLGWYSDFKQRSQFLKYPIGNDLLTSIAQIISELGPIMNGSVKVPPETRDSYIKIYTELSDINKKNAEYFKTAG